MQACPACAGVWPPLVAALELRGSRDTAVSAMKVMYYMLGRDLSSTQVSAAAKSGFCSSG